MKHPKAGKKLLFFDIDGTILRTYGTGRKAVVEALSSTFNCPIDTQNINFGGKTDPQILAEVLRANDIPDTKENIEAASEAYMHAVRQLMPESRVQVMPNVSPVLEAFHHHPQVELSLLTGNYEPMAFLKLAKVNLDHYFNHGAFGSDHTDRNELPSIGIKRIEALLEHTFHPQDVFVIGDTPRDIECAHTAGIRCIAVATGDFSMEDLHVADLVLPDLTHEEALHAFIFGD